MLDLAVIYIFMYCPMLYGKAYLRAVEAEAASQPTGCEAESQPSLHSKASAKITDVVRCNHFCIRNSAYISPGIETKLHAIVVFMLPTTPCSRAHAMLCSEASTLFKIQTLQSRSRTTIQKLPSIKTIIASAKHSSYAPAEDSQHRTEPRHC